MCLRSPSVEAQSLFFCSKLEEITLFGVTELGALSLADAFRKAEYVLFDFVPRGATWIDEVMPPLDLIIANGVAQTAD